MVNQPIDDTVLAVSDFVALLNQTLEYAYPSVMVQGELANFRVNRNRWVYFDLKDELASVKCFGTVYQLPGPLEDGMLLNVRAQPRLHPLYGFSLNIMNIRPAGEGAIRKAAALLEAKLAAEGLFETARKRYLPYPPARIGLVASGESAAYADFMKILNARWKGLEIVHADVQVQGEAAPGQIVAAIEQLNGLAEPPEVLVVTRGGGSAEDLQAFSTEQVTRAVAASRVPTLVAIGHEVDVSLAELAADRRASTPSNAAEMLVPDRNAVLVGLKDIQQRLAEEIEDILTDEQRFYREQRTGLHQTVEYLLSRQRSDLKSRKQLLGVLSPRAVLSRGYAIIHTKAGVVRTAKELEIDDNIQITFGDGSVEAAVTGKRSG